jgi:hypothetical protein
MVADLYLHCLVGIDWLGAVWRTLGRRVPTYFSGSFPILRVDAQNGIAARCQVDGPTVIAAIAIAEQPG